MKRIARALVFLGLVACGAGTAGKAVKPTAPTANDALGHANTCKQPSDEPQLLTLDWDDSLRIDLERGMSNGIVVVKYDCNGLKILRDCHAAGTYDYAGFSPAKTSAKLADDDQVQANLPIGAAKFSSDISRGSTIDIVYMAVGQQSTTVHDVPAAKLSGTCEGATHTVRNANLGAFAVSVGTKGQVNAAVELLSHGGSGSSSSSTAIQKANGELDACDKANDRATEPTARCRALVELLLSPIGGKATNSPDDEPSGKGVQAEPIKERCADGYASDKSGLCAKKDPAAASLCKADDFDDCKAQCEKGNGMSCYNAGANRVNPKYNKTTYSEPNGALKDAYPFFDKACAAGVPTGCGHLGLLTMLGVGTAKDHAKADTLMTRGCSGGDAWTCRFLGLQYEFGRNGYGKDPAMAFTLVKRSCALGDQRACVTGARDLAEGVGVTKDLSAALKMMSKACDAGDQGVCDRANNLRSKLDAKTGAGDKAGVVAHTKFGIDPIDNPCAQGLRVSPDGVCIKADPSAKFICDPSDIDECKTRCDGGDGASCYNAAANRVGKWNAGGAPQDAYPYLEKSCKAGYAAGCGELGNALTNGAGVKANATKAMGFYDKGCTGGDQPSCRFLATTYEKKSAKKAAKYYKKLCDLGDTDSCAKSKAK